MSHPFLAEVPVPERGIGVHTEMRYALDGFLRTHDNRRWPGSLWPRGDAPQVVAYAFASEMDAAEFVTVFQGHGARRITP